MTEQFYNHIPCMASRDGLVCDQEKGHGGMHGDHRKEDPVFWMDRLGYTQDLAPVRIKENNNEIGWPYPEGHS